MRKPLGARTTSFAFVNLGKKKNKKRKRNRTIRRSTKLVTAKEEKRGGMKTRSCDFLRFHADGEGKKEGNKEFRGGKLAKKKKYGPSVEQ